MLGTIFKRYFTSGKLGSVKLPRINLRRATDFQNVKEKVFLINNKANIETKKYDVKVIEDLFQQESFITDIKKTKCLWTWDASGRSLYLVDNSDLTNLKSSSRDLRLLGGSIATASHSRLVKSTNVLVPELYGPEHISYVLNGFLLANNSFSKKKDEDPFVEEINLFSNHLPESEEKLAAIQDYRLFLKSAEATLFARSLANERADVANTQEMMEVAKEIALANPEKVTFEAIIGEDLLKNQLNLHYSVGKGSKNPPILAMLQYKGNPDQAEDITAILGKGLCFDSGGLNIKPTGSMETMYTDKAGACAALGAFRSAVELGLKINLVCVIGLAENFISEKCYRPSDIIRSHKGLTVEIGNTDAEGRLVLADAMSYLQQKFKPKTLIELSTLTGACVIALGKQTGGLFSNNDELAQELLAASQVVNEPLWRLPISEEHREEIKGSYADLDSIGKSRFGGSSKAAAFLERFVEDGVRWAHLDIAGPADTASSRPLTPKGATGFGAALVLNYIHKIASKNSVETPQQLSK
eukprot:TRINITY_DN13081_c0_g1_i1.p1 TRINITY_DN13081_c0_g1~~TRINITY_DN13081_c0_g1_i1.p1  ORF type:complete len:527 (+),score=105.26 TRINITY_DN13081_c0_g1_i1:60-1640(+)